VWCKGGPQQIQDENGAAQDQKNAIVRALKMHKHSRKHKEKDKSKGKKGHKERDKLKKGRKAKKKSKSAKKVKSKGHKEQTSSLGSETEDSANSSDV
jgi:hypothetical protein